MALAKKDKNSISQFTWESFLNYYNDLIDQEIVSFCKNKKNYYYGGKCTISSEIKADEFTKNTFLIVVSKLYYRENATEKTIERIIRSRFNYSEFKQDNSTLSKLRELLKNNIEFDIEAPNKGGKA